MGLMEGRGGMGLMLWGRRGVMGVEGWEVMGKLAGGEWRRAGLG